MSAPDRPSSALGDDRWNGHRVSDLTTAGVLAHKAAHNGDKVFLTYLPDGRRLTYRDLDRQSNRLAHGFAAAGIGQGTHVAMLMDNSPEQLLSYFALGKLGAVCVPINTASRGQQLHYLLCHSEAQALIVDAELLDALAQLEQPLPALRRIYVHGTASQPGASACPPAAAVGSLQEAFSHDDGPIDAAVKFNDVSYIMYTSGTTGPSKGVLLTQAQCFLWGLSHAQAFGQRPDDVAYICLPLFHTNALQGATYNALMVDASIVVQKRFSASRFWRDIRDSGATLTNLLGSMINILWNQPPDARDSDHAIRMCMSAPIPSFGVEFEQRFGLRFIQSYSLTDFGPSHAYSLVDPIRKLGSCGRVRAGVRARIVDDLDFELPPGARGELVLRHDMAWAHSQGYYKMPEATVKAWRNGWFHTGDHGYVDEDGYFWFLDRAKDAIRRRGENISAYEGEQVLLRHPAIQDAAVFAVRSEQAEDEVAAAIVAKEGQALHYPDIVEFCRTRMAYYMVPRYWAVLRDLPRNTSQKVEKFKLRSWADDDPSRLWDREAAGIVIKRGQ